MADSSDNEIAISIILDDGSVREGFARIQKSGEDTGAGLAQAFSMVKNTMLEVLAVYIGFEAGKKFVEQSIEAASAYEKSLNDVNKALSSAGSYSQAASEQFVAFAETMAANSTLSDKQVLSLEALARNYAHSNEQALKLTQAAIDLGAATGKGPEVALQQLGGTLEGTAGRIAKLVPQVKDLTKYQLESGAAIDIVAARFKDAAKGDVNTYEGAIRRLSNAFETVEKTVGQFITQSPTIRAIIQFITTELGAFAKYLSGFGGGAEATIKTLAQDFIYVGEVINKYLIYPIEILYNVAKVVFDAIGASIADMVGSIAIGAGKLIQYFKPNSEMAKSLVEFGNGAKDIMRELDVNTQEALKHLGDSKWTDGIANGLQTLSAKIDNAKIPKKLKDQVGGLGDDLVAAALKANTVESSFVAMKNGVISATADMVIHSGQLMQQLGATAIKSLGGGFAQAMAAVGKAAVQGKDIFKAFAGAMISALGSALIQMGAGYIMLGLAREISSYGADPTGYELIGVGSGMAALGGVLEAVGGNVSGSSSSASSYSGGGGGGSSGGIAGNPATNVQQQQHATINIQGSIFDSKETGLRIVELVNAAFTNQGVSVITQ